ncbi:MAG: grasp-with-spasm system SPASM domain peptide maturase [Flavobacteriales bacterium]|nr:grasp-with-spasm system SPASM domain peptide maturase [Flavobacteriales bacterium]
MIDKTHFKFFASCIPVKGYKESVILDIERGNIFPIPNLLFDVLEKNKVLTIDDLKAHYNGEWNKGIDHYFDYFNEKNIGFFTNEPSSFPDLSPTWKNPLKIINAIIEYSMTSDYSLKEVIQQLSAIGCEAIQIRLFHHLEVAVLLNELEAIKNSRIRYCELFVPYTDNLNRVDLYKIRDFDARVAKIIIHSSPWNKCLKHKKRYYNDIFYFSQKVIDQTYVEQYSIQNMVANVYSYTEAFSHNLGLNRKVSIARNGDIKNYPTHKSCFGNVIQDRIEDIIEKESFKKKWYVSNDNIEKCRDCQYRYACVSNSDIEETDGRYYKKELCNFDPYMNEWNLDSNYQSK